MQWQPIETAPKDGTVVDLWFSERTYAGYKSAGYRVPDAYYIDRSVMTYYGEQKHEKGWMIELPYEGEVNAANHIDEEPTHWMLSLNPHQ